MAKSEIRLQQTKLDGSDGIEIKSNLKWRKAWLFPRIITKWFEAFVDGYFSLNVCCGQSKIGDVRLDMDLTQNLHVQGAMHMLPFKNCSFDRVISDPPWGLNFFHRSWPFFEMVRVCKVGGLIALNSTWIPYSKSVSELEMFVRNDIPFGMSSIVSTWQKFTSQYDNY